MSLDDYGSIVHWFPDKENHSCGYCKQEETSTSYGMWAEILTVEDYQNLIDRGWRRSGKYCYKAIMDETCCPLYTIRCEADLFKISKSQKKVVKKFKKYLMDGKQDENTSSSNANNMDSSVETYIKEPTNKLNLSTLDKAIIEKIPSSAKKRCTKPKVGVFVSDNPSNSEEASNFNSADARGKQKKAKLLRLERKMEKLKAKGMSVDVTPKESVVKSVEEFLDITDSDFKIVFVPTSVPGREWERTKAEEYEVYKKYQMVIHGDPPDKCTEKGFHRFLVHSPLQPSKPEGGPSMGYGSFHQQYWLGNKLIAVGVIDILPFCVSSVYFFYDPEYRHLTLGTFGTLQEIKFTRELHRSVSDLQYYYMGFYIHSCPKMRYKANYKPSYLLCPETYVWFPLEGCIQKLDASKYSRLSDDVDALDENCCTGQNVDEIKVIVGYKGIIPYKYYKKKYGGQNIFTNMGRLLGRLSAESLLIVMPMHDP